MKSVLPRLNARERRQCREDELAKAKKIVKKRVQFEVFGAHTKLANERIPLDAKFFAEWEE